MLKDYEELQSILKDLQKQCKIHSRLNKTYVMPAEDKIPPYYINILDNIVKGGKITVQVNNQTGKIDKHGTVHQLMLSAILKDKSLSYNDKTFYLTNLQAAIDHAINIDSIDFTSLPS